MSERFMLDTNVSSHVIKGNHPTVRAKLAATPIARICISAISEAELRYGVARKGNPSKLFASVREFLLRVDVLPWTSSAAEAYADLRARLERDGTPLGSHDLLIAAHAISCDAVLVTNDRAFRRVSGLKLADWSDG